MLQVPRNETRNRARRPRGVVKVSKLGTELDRYPVLCRVLVFAAGRPTPSRRRVGGCQSARRRMVGRRVFDRLFCTVAVGGRALLRSQRVAQDIIEHLGARLRPVTKRCRHLRANCACVGLAGTEPA
jgi:hypothetical protein